MKIRGTILGLLLAGVVQVPGLEYANPTLGFKATLPDGLKDMSATVMLRDSLVTLGRLSPDKRLLERLVLIQDLGAMIGQEVPPASVIPKNARVEKVPWKSYEVLLFVVTEAEAGVTSMRLNAQVPLKPRAIQVSVVGPQSQETQLRQELRAIVASVDGSTNWGELAAAAPQKRLEKLSRGLGRLWWLGCLLVIVVVAAIKTSLARKSKEGAEEAAPERTSPVGRLLVCAGVIYAVLVGMMVYADKGTTNLAFRMGYTVGSLFIPVVLTGIWAGMSSKNWGWFRCGVTLVAMCILVTVIRAAPQLSKASARENGPPPAAVESQAR